MIEYYILIILLSMAGDAGTSAFTTMRPGSVLLTWKKTPMPAAGISQKKNPKETKKNPQRKFTPKKKYTLYLLAWIVPVLYDLSWKNNAHARYWEQEKKTINGKTACFPIWEEMEAHAY